MTINPDECAECAGCFGACPIGAIVESEEKNPEYARINAELAPAFKNNPAFTARPANDPPRRPENKLAAAG